MSAPAPTQPSSAIQRGIVKQVLSGDALVIRGQPKGGPPPERTICFANIQAPKLARRANPNTESSETKDEPWAWEAREFLRKKVVGHEVAFTVEYKAPGTVREYGCVYLGKDTSGENLTEAMIIEGFVEVRKMGLKSDDPAQQRLVQLEEAAIQSKRGKFSESKDAEHIRDIKWVIENPRNFVDSHHNKPIDAVIEHVRDGCTIRAFLLPTMEYVTVMLSGIKCPMFKQDSEGKQLAEQFAEEARYFTESRLLQRDIQIILEGVSNQNLLGTLVHPNGNIAEVLLREGFARCVDWSMGVVTNGAEKLRAAEKVAKDKKSRIWKDYTPSTSNLNVKEKSFSGKVLEVVGGDSMLVKLENGSKKIFLSSIKPPRAQNQDGDNKDPKQRSRPLYDVPYLFEAREFLRKKLTGKKVSVEVDYVQPANQGFPEKTCCTVTIGGINVGEAVVSKGLATVIRYRQDDDQRSAHYDVLLAAEARSQKKMVGLHAKKDAPIHRVADLSGDVQKAKQFLPFLQRAGKTEGLVEFIASGSRLRLYLPKSTCLITLLISGIDCPKGARPQGGVNVPADPYGEEALAFTKEMCLQREVSVEVETIDKGGNFIGWLFVDDINLSVNIVEAGLAKVHFTAERSNYYKYLVAAEEKAKTEKIGIWEHFVEPKEEEIKEEPSDRKINYKTVVVTEVTEELVFYAQNVENGPQLEKMMEQLRQDMDLNPPLPGAYKAKLGDICASKFSADGQWYRAKILRIDGNKITVKFIDYGNKEVTSEVATLPSSYQTLPAQATEYCLACIALPTDLDARREAVDALFHEVLNKQFSLNSEYRVPGSVEHVSLQYPDTKVDVAQSLISQGYLLAERRRERRLAKMVSDYYNAQEKAKSERRNLWRYGDFTDDDAKEFGYQR